ncbi:MAG: sugar ABC transporter substrate-binding protein [Armatimonadetes bacterium]|nr:sugar ABC transporter substrate-binding protein [Armatimonadota bacterium]
MRRRILLVLCLILTLLAAPVAGPLTWLGAGPSTRLGTGLAGGPLFLEFWTISLQPFFNDYINNLITRYEVAHPGVKVRWVDVQIHAIEQKLLAAVAGGVPPDVVNLNTEFAVRLAEQGALADMDTAVSAADRAKYFEGLWASTRFKGRTYGIPWYVTPSVLAYNTEIFKKAGLDPAKPPATEDAMIDAARRIKDRTKIYGFMPNVDGVRMMHRFREAGLPLVSPDGKRAVFNSPAHVKVLETYVALLKKDYFPEDALRRGYLGATERYSAGRLAMLITGPQFLLRVRKDNPQVYAKTDVAPYPLDRGSVVHAPLMNLAVPKSGRNQGEAVRFALHVTSDESQLAFGKLVVIFPSTRKAAGDPFFARPGSTPEEKARYIGAQSLRYARDLTVVVPRSGDLFRVFREAMEGAFFGKMGPKDALEWAVREWNARL